METQVNNFASPRLDDGFCNELVRNTGVVSQSLEHDTNRTKTIPRRPNV